MGQHCSTHKVCYDSEQMAEDALIEAWIRYDFDVGQGPVNVYQCEDCGSYHFTSQGTMSVTLKDFIESGKIEMLREARRWEDKLRRR